jgi:hypothetical protein
MTIPEKSCCPTLQKICHGQKMLFYIIAGNDGVDVVC